MMKKRFLFLLLSALLCSTGGMYAQTVTANSIKSIKDLEFAMEQIEKVPDLKADLDNVKAEVRKLEGEKPTTITNPTETTLKKIVDIINTFDFDGTKFYYIEVQTTKSTGALSSSRLCIATDKSILEEATKHLVSQSTTTGYPKFYNRTKASDPWEQLNGTDVNSWTTVTLNNDILEDEDLYESLCNISKSKCKNAYVYYKKNDGSVGCTNYITLGTANEDVLLSIETIVDKIEADDLERITPKPTEDGEDSEELKADPDYIKWFKKYYPATQTLSTAQTAYNNAVAFKTLTIGGEITVNKADVAEGAESYLGDWPDGCKINGKGYRIINEQGKPLFDKNNGDISNWISLNQNIANSSSSSAHVRNTIARTADGTGYNVYNGEGNLTSTTNLEDAVYTLRTVYGMDLTKGESSIGAVTDATKLYQVQYANATNKNVYKFKANIAGQEFVYDKNEAETNGVTSLSCDNAVVYIDNADAADDPNGVKGLTNVAINSKKDGTISYVCQKAKLIEGSSSPEFYVPFAFTAKNLDYSREVTSDIVSVCLPFALTSGVLSKIETATGLQVNAYRFKQVDAQKNIIWFNPLSSVDANKPCILSFKDADNKAAAPGKAVFTGLTDVNFASTAGAELSSNSINTNEKRFFGNYKPGQKRGDLASQANEKGATGSAIYGLQGGKLVMMSETSRMNVFRSFVVWTEDLTTNPSNAPIFRVGFLDKDGNEDIVTGIESVGTANNDTAAFKAVGGHNAIEITTGKACDVKVYTLNGALAKTARVEAGTTTLPMNAGMYVVNKTKVIVK